jgi:hypothetical protein
MKITALLVLTFIAALVIFVVGMFLVTDYKAVKSSEKTAQEVVANETSNETAQVLPKVSSCGDKKCESFERCNFSTFTTGCVQDCSYTCPQKVIISSHVSDMSSMDAAFVCNDSTCTQMSNNNFLFKGSSAIKTFLVNVGELRSNRLTANFFCSDMADPAVRATRDGDVASGVMFSSYFTTDHLQNVELDGNQLGKNKADFYLTLTPTSDFSGSPEFYCYLTFTGEEPLQQKLNIKVTQ